MLLGPNAVPCPAQSVRNTSDSIEPVRSECRVVGGGKRGLDGHRTNHCSGPDSSPHPTPQQPQTSAHTRKHLPPPFPPPVPRSQCPTIPRSLRSALQREQGGKQTAPRRAPFQRIRSTLPGGPAGNRCIVAAPSLQHICDNTQQAEKRCARPLHTPSTSTALPSSSSFIFNHLQSSSIVFTVFIPLYRSVAATLSPLQHTDARSMWMVLAVQRHQDIGLPHDLWW